MPACLLVSGGLLRQANRILPGLQDWYVLRRLCVCSAFVMGTLFLREGMDMYVSVLPLLDLREECSSRRKQSRTMHVPVFFGNRTHMNNTTTNIV